MPRQNRVNPFGEIITAPERGTFMGNRGVLHDEEGSIRRAWLGKRWIACVLEFRGRKRKVMTPDRYTELFFLDEATAFAAGHRPCAECRRERFNAFRNAWRLEEDLQPPTAAEIDDQLHNERLDPDKNGERLGLLTTATLGEGGCGDRSSVRSSSSRLSAVASRLKTRPGSEVEAKPSLAIPR